MFIHLPSRHHSFRLAIEEQSRWQVGVFCALSVADLALDLWHQVDNLLVLGHGVSVTYFNTHLFFYDTKKGTLVKNALKLD